MSDDAVFPDGENQEGTEQKSVEELLQELLTEQKNHRAEVAAMREELAKAKTPAPQVNLSVVKTAEQLLEERMAEIRQHSHYCPGCGKLSKYMRECSGKAEAPHPPIDMVPTEELLGDDSSKHTAAPDTVNIG